MTDEEKAAEAKPENRIEITPTQAYCSRHGEPFRAEWPKGAIYTQVKMFERLLGAKASEPEKLWAEAARLLGLPEDASEPIPVRDACKVLFDKKPMCCRIGDKIMRKLYEGAGIGKIGRCEVCRRKNRKCVPVKVKDPHERTIERVCFDCVLKCLRNSPPGN